jgi:predicted RNase H-like HicB family nuclease
MVYKIHLQVKRTCQTHAHVPALPGCNWVAASPEEACQQAEVEIRRHLDWLHRYGSDVPPCSEAITPVVVQKHMSTAREGYLVGFFDCDLEPVQREEIPGFLALMSFAREELLALTQALPEALLSWQPGPKEWSIAEVLRHVAGVQRYYLTRIIYPDLVPIQQPFRSVWKRLASMQALSTQLLMELSGEQLSAVVAASSGELWTARKVFRRFIEHEREHTFHIQEILEKYPSEEKF